MKRGFSNSRNGREKWISVPVNFQGGTLRARKRFSLEKEVRRARVFVCGLGYHELYINGTKQGDAVLNPGVTAYDKRVLYCAYDIGSDLQKGDNVIGVELGYGWYCGRKLIAQVYVEYTDGTVYRDYTANGYGWWMGGAPSRKTAYTAAKCTTRGSNPFIR